MLRGILKYTVIYFSGGVFGMVFGLEVLDPLLDPPTKKLAFVSIWFSFAFALFLLNREHKRKTFDSIPNCFVWEPLVLIITGLCDVNYHITWYSIYSYTQNNSTSI